MDGRAVIWTERDAIGATNGPSTSRYRESL
jgi:hypothetical protein